MTRLQLSHTIVVRLFLQKTYVVILTSVTVGSFSSSSWSGRFHTQDEAMEDAWPAPMGAHYRADVINLLSLWEIKGICNHQLAYANLVIPRWATHLWGLRLLVLFRYSAKFCCDSS